MAVVVPLTGTAVQVAVLCGAVAAAARQREMITLKTIGLLRREGKASLLGTVGSAAVASWMSEAAVLAVTGSSQAAARAVLMRAQRTLWNAECRH